MLLALFDIVDLLLTILSWIIIIQVILSWLFAFNVLNTSSRRRARASRSRSIGSRRRSTGRSAGCMPDFGGLDFSPLVVLILIQYQASCSHGASRSLYLRRMTARLIDGKAAAAAIRDQVARARRRVREAHRPRAGPGHRAGRRGPGERGLCPLEGQRDGRGRHGELRAQSARHDFRGRAARPGRRAQRRRRGRRNPRPAAAAGADRFDAGDRAIEPDKDVDGFHPLNAGRLAAGLDALVPCTPLGCLHLLKPELGRPRRARGGGDRPLEHRRQADGACCCCAKAATVTIAHSKTRDLPDVVRRADIVVAAVGRAEMVRGDWIKPGATVIDVGINRLSDRRRQGPAGRRRRLRRGGRGRRRDHPGPGRRRADDHRHADAQHVASPRTAAPALPIRRAYDRRHCCSPPHRSPPRSMPSALSPPTPSASASGPHFANMPTATR